MSAKVVQFNAPSSEIVGLPKNLMRLRWRITSTSGVSVSSAWIPETRFPSLSKTIEEFKGKIGSFYVDAEEVNTARKYTLFRIEGAAFKKAEYKGMGSLNLGYSIVAGFEIVDNDGTTYLILRDGTVTQFKAKEITQ